MPSSKLRIGVSACLLGRKVRWDGADRRDPFVADALGAFAWWVPVCPEVELGLGVPREPIRLVGAAAAPRLVGERSGRDLTAAMERLARRRAREIDALGICGFVTKSGSPSCGLAAVPVHPARGGAPRREGTGLFARALARLAPPFPVEEESALADPARRASFVERVFACHRLREVLVRLNPVLTPRERKRLAHAVASFARGRSPLEVPLALARRLLRVHPVPWLSAQSWLHPDPREVALAEWPRRPRSAARPPAARSGARAARPRRSPRAP